MSCLYVNSGLGLTFFLLFQLVCYTHVFSCVCPRVCVCSVPALFVMGSRHVKEILESLYDEFNWLTDQWIRRNATLQRSLTYNQFLDETKKV